MKKTMRRIYRRIKKSKRARTVFSVAVAGFIAIIIIATALLVLRAKPAKTLSIAISGEPETLDPAYASCPDFSTVNALAFEGLMKFDENGNPQKAVASSYTVSGDGLTYSFTLGNSLWSNGERVTSEDFAFAWERAADSERNPEYAYLFDNIDRIEVKAKTEENEETEETEENEEAEEEEEENSEEAVETETKLNLVTTDSAVLTVHLKKPDSGFLSKCAMSVFSPVCKKVVAANTRIWGYTPDSFVSNGEYVLSQWQRDSYLVLTKNEKYSGEMPEKIPDNIKVYFASDEESAVSLFKDSTVLYSSAVSEEACEKYRNKSYFFSQPDYGTYYIMFNQGVKPFNDKNVRLALSLAIDREELAESLGEWNFEPANKILSPAFKTSEGSSLSDSLKTNINLSDSDENIKKAKELLASAGYPEGKGFPAFTYMYNDNTYHQTVARCIIKMWKENLGITCEEKPLPYSKFNDNRQYSNFTAVRDGVICPNGDTLPLVSKFTSENDISSWKNPQYDSLFSTLNTTADISSRFDITVQCCDILTENEVCCPLLWYKNCYLASGKLKNYYVLPDGTAYFNAIKIR